MTYSLDFRKRALDLLGKRYSFKSVSEIMDVGVTSLQRWRKRQSRGQLAAEYPSSRVAYKIDEDKLKSYILDNPDSHLEEIAQAIGSREARFTAPCSGLG